MKVAVGYMTGHNEKASFVPLASMELTSKNEVSLDTMKEIHRAVTNHYRVAMKILIVSPETKPKGKDYKWDPEHRSNGFHRHV
jgi:hypothetical protein